MINKNKYCILNLAFLRLCLEIYFTFGEKYEALGKDSTMGDAMAMRSLLENNLGMIIAFDGQGNDIFEWYCKRGTGLPAGKEKDFC